MTSSISRRDFLLSPYISGPNMYAPAIIDRHDDLEVLLGPIPLGEDGRENTVIDVEFLVAVDRPWWLKGS
jgi:hypothetical protein